jgi:hypothetical protein
VFLDPGPFLSHLSGLGEVPVWFVDTSDYEDAIADGQLTIGDLEGRIGALGSSMGAIAPTALGHEGHSELATFWREIHHDPGW